MQQTDLLFGHVQDAAGNPVEGATVVAVSTIHEQEGILHRSRNVTDISVLTDNNGDFTLEVSPPLGPRIVSGKECIALRLRHPDYADRHVTRAELGLYELNPVITLYAASVIEGRIEGWVDTSDMSVKASNEPDPFGHSPAWSASRGVGTDNSFQFDNVPAGEIYLHLMQEPNTGNPFCNSVRLSRAQSVRIEPGESKAIIFQREDVGEITGVLRGTKLDENVLLKVALCSGAPEGEHESLTQWRGCNGSTFTLLNLTEPGKQFFLRIKEGSFTIDHLRVGSMEFDLPPIDVMPISFDYPLSNSSRLDRDVGELNF